MKKLYAFVALIVLGISIHAGVTSVAKVDNASKGYHQAVMKAADI